MWETIFLPTGPSFFILFFFIARVTFSPEVSQSLRVKPLLLKAQ